MIKSFFIVNVADIDFIVVFQVLYWFKLGKALPLKIWDLRCAF